MKLSLLTLFKLLSSPAPAVALPCEILLLDPELLAMFELLGDLAVPALKGWGAVTKPPGEAVRNPAPRSSACGGVCVRVYRRECVCV
jgi:hypothetical protein